MLSGAPRVGRLLVPAETSRVIRTNLAVVGVFVVVALVLLTRTLIASAGIGGDIDGAVNPQMAEIGTDTLRLPALDRTAPLVERIAEAVAPLHRDLAATVDSTGDIDVTTGMISGDVDSIGASIEGIDASVTAIRASVERLVPIVAAIRADTGDITATFAETAGRTEAVEASAADIVTRLGGTAAAVAHVDSRVREVDGALGRVADHTENIENSAVLRLTDLPPPSRAARPAAEVG